MSEMLEAAIARDPDDDAAYLVYADWLQQRGDPRGELIMLQHRGQDAAAAALLRRHASHFYGSLAARPALLDVTWHLGFLRTCRFELDEDRQQGHEHRALAALEDLLALPSARFLRELSLGVMNVPYNTFQPAIEVLARHDLGTLRRLAIGDAIEHANQTRVQAFTTDIGPTRALYAAAPNLESLVLRSTDLDADVDGIALPRLTELRFSGLGRESSLAAILRVPLPALVTLELVGTFGTEAAAWRPLLDGVGFPALRHLTIGVSSYIAKRAPALIAHAPLLRQLHTLDLSGAFMTEADADALIASSAAFGHLERLELGPPMFVVLDPARDAALRGLCANVVVSSRIP